MLVEKCEVLGLRLRIDRGVLKADAPKGVMTAGLVAQLKAHKSELLATTLAQKPVNLDARLCCRAIVANPYALLDWDNRKRCQIIGRVEPPSPEYSTVKYLRLLLKYVPGRAPSGTPEIWLDTYIPHSQDKIKTYLKKSGDCGHLTWRLSGARSGSR